MTQWSICFLLLSSLLFPAIMGQSPIDQLVKERFDPNGKSETARVQEFFKWVASEIDYDTGRSPTLLEPDTAQSPALQALHRRKAVCSGYAHLMVEMCKSAGIRAFVAEGKARQSRNGSLENHAWVIFLADGKWQAADPTWGAGYVRKGRFEREVSYDYFQIEAEQLIETHYPYEPAFQLLYPPKNFREFVHHRKASPKNDLPHYDTVLDSMESTLSISSLDRANRMKPEDHFIQHALAVAIMDAASGQIKPCMEALSNQAMNEIAEADCTKVVQTTKEQLLRARDLLRRIIEEDGKQKFTAQLNLQTVDRNLMTVRQMNQFMGSN